jgi:alcohol dehydrogenase (cytochrome c)
VRPHTLILLITIATAPAQDNWLTYDGDPSGRRFSTLDQIHRGNVRRLAPAWVYQIPRVPLRSEATPLVRDGVMYFTAGGSQAYALDGRTGRELWAHYRLVEGKQGADWNRGLALSGNRAFFTTTDCKLTALDTRNGSVVWSTSVREPEPCYGSTAAPLIVNQLVLVGQRGGDIGIRGHLDARDAETGKLVWRRYTIPAPGEKGSDTWPGTEVWKKGGAATWTTGTYDPALNLIYWTTGNPGPDDYNGSNRKGDNLFADSVLALRPRDGELVWHFQFTPHDVWDWDSNETPVLVDAAWGGRPRKLLLQANRNATFYVLDRQTGEFLLQTPFATRTWAGSFTPQGRPVLAPNVIPVHQGTRVCPDVHGGTNWQSPSYNPVTRLFYVIARDSCGFYYPDGFTIDTESQTPRQLLRALDIGTGETRWEIPILGTSEILHAGTMTTAGGLVFFSSREGLFMAADAESGKLLWHFNTGGTIRASAMTYRVAGKQYVAILTKAAVFAFALIGDY